MQPDEGARDCQAQSGTTSATGIGFAVETFKERGALVGGNARTFVADTQRYTISLYPCLQGHGAVGWRIADSVGEQVMQHLLNPTGIRHKSAAGTRRSRLLNVQGDSLFLLLISNICCRRSHGFTQLDLIEFKLHDPGINRGQIKQIVHQPMQLVG